MDIQGDPGLARIIEAVQGARKDLAELSPFGAGQIVRLPEKYEAALKARLDLDVIETDRKRRLRNAQVEALDLDTRERLLISLLVREAVAHAIAVERLNVRFPR